MASGISPGGRPIDESPLSTSKTSNWVARNGGLPSYVRGIARGIAKKHGGKVTSSDIAMAWEQVKKLALTSKSPAIKAAAARAVAQEVALRAKAHSHSNESESDVDLSWDSFDQARGKHPRQKKAQPAPAATGAVAGYTGPAMSQDVIDKVKAFQQANKLPVTGNLDEGTVNFAKQYPEKVAEAAAAKKAASAQTTADNKKKAEAKRVAAAALKEKKAAAAKIKAQKTAADKKTKAAASAAKKVASDKTKAAKAVIAAKKKKISTTIANLNVDMAKARIAKDTKTVAALTIQIAQLRAQSSAL